MTRDTPQQKMALRTNRTARKVRLKFPEGTRVVAVGGPDGQPGTVHGTVVRHVPGTNAQGGHLVIEWDNGAKNNMVAAGLAKVEA